MHIQRRPDSSHTEPSVKILRIPLCPGGVFVQINYELGGKHVTKPRSVIELKLLFAKFNPIK